VVDPLLCLCTTCWGRRNAERKRRTIVEVPTVKRRGDYSSGVWMGGEYEAIDAFDEIWWR